MSQVYEHSEPREQDGPPWTLTHASEGARLSSHSREAPATGARWGDFHTKRVQWRTSPRASRAGLMARRG
jgi:hypothetical protein